MEKDWFLEVESQLGKSFNCTIEQCLQAVKCKHNKETHVDTTFITSSSNDTVTSRKQYLQILGELFEWQTQLLVFT